MTTEVVHIVRQYFPSIGGMEEVVRNIARHQTAKHNHRVRIVTLDRLFRNNHETLPSEDQVDGIPVTRLPYYGSSRYPLCPSILRQVNSADVVHVHGVDFFYDFIGFTKWLHRRPIMLSTHGGFFHTQFASTLKKTYFKTVTRLCAKNYDKVVATSNNDGDIFKEIIKTPKLEVIENGVDVEKFAKLGSRFLRPTMIYFGRWSANKGLLETLQLFSRLVQTDSRWRLIIAGREYDLTETQLIEYAEQLHVAKNLEIVSSPSDDQLRKLIQKASYYICLSRHEGFGIAPLEAMSAGLIPILSAIPPFKRLIDSSRIGMLINDMQTELNNEATTESITTTFIKEMQSLHDQLSSNYETQREAAIQFAQSYAWPSVAERYVSIYNSLGQSAFKSTSLGAITSGKRP